MDLLVSVIQIVKDLLGALNPFRLVRRGSRTRFLEVWKHEPMVFRIGYVLGSIGLLALLLLAGYYMWSLMTR